MITEFGQIPSHWKISSIKEETELVTDYVANGSFASLKENVTYSSIPDYAVIIRLTDFNNQFKGPFVYVSKSAYEFLKKSKLNGGEIIISNVGAYTGTVFRTPKLSIPKTLGPNSIMVNFKGSNDFYEYWFKSKFGQFMIQGIISGSAQPKFNKTSFRSLSIPVPPLEEQKAIAEVLSSLDDKIELLQQQNETLEALAQTLFRQWFIEEADNNWEEVELGALVELTRGISYKGSDISVSKTQGVPIHSLKSMSTEGEYNFDGIKYYTASYKEKFSLDPGDLLMVNTDMTPNNRIIGWPILVPDSFKVSVSTHHLYSVKIIDQRITKLYLYYLLKTPSYRNLMANSANGTTVSMLSQAAVKALKITIPEIRTLQKFEAFIKPIDDKKSLNQRSIESLRLTRETLLPKLMSGQVRVKLD